MNSLVKPLDNRDHHQSKSSSVLPSTPVRTSSHSSNPARNQVKLSSLYNKPLPPRGGGVSSSGSGHNNISSSSHQHHNGGVGSSSGSHHNRHHSNNSGLVSGNNGNHHHHASSSNASNQHHRGGGSHISSNNNHGHHHHHRGADLNGSRTTNTSANVSPSLNDNNSRTVLLGSDDNRTPLHRRQLSAQIHTDSTYDDVASHASDEDEVDTSPQTTTTSSESSEESTDSDNTSLSELPSESRFKTFVKKKTNKLGGNAVNNNGIVTNSSGGSGELNTNNEDDEHVDANHNHHQNGHEDRNGLGENNVSSSEVVNCSGGDGDGCDDAMTQQQTSDQDVRSSLASQVNDGGFSSA